MDYYLFEISITALILPLWTNIGNKRVVSTKSGSSLYDYSLIVYNNAFALAFLILRAYL